MLHPRTGSTILLLGVAGAAFLGARLNGSRQVPSQLAKVESGALDVRHFGARGDGRSDDTAAIQSVINAKIGTVRLDRGIYRVTKPLVVELDRVGVTSVVGDGTATIVMAGPGPALRFVGTHQGTASPDTVRPEVWQRQRTPMVDGVEIVGEHAQATGIQADGTMQLTVSRVVIRRALHGIHLVSRNRNVIVSQCHIYHNRGVGIFYDNVDLHQSNIEGCHISYNSEGGIVVRGGNVRNIHVGTCDIEANMAADAPPTANIVLDATGGSIGEVAIVGCTIQHSHSVPGSANIRIDSRSNPLKFTDELRHGNVTIADNVLSDVQINVDVQNTRGVTITGNTMWKGYQHDLRVVNSSNVVIGNNVFDRNPRYHYGDGSQSRGGLALVDCTDCTFNGNHVRGTGDIAAAVMLQRCRRMNVTGSTILDAHRIGLLLQDVTESRVSDCLIRSVPSDSPQRVSLRIEGGGNNMIVDNYLDEPPEIDASDVHAAGNYEGN